MHDNIVGVRRALMPVNTQSRTREKGVRKERERERKRKRESERDLSGLLLELIPENFPRCR